jgi:UDP-N-acetylmuramoyl-L-alanyl-D-glutamate--2,6-diaminopimelate ligase
LKKLFEGLEYKIINEGLKKEYTGIEYDSRKIKKDNIFFALEGSTFDGHNFIEKAVENGATMVVVSKDVEICNKDVTFIKVENTRNIMGKVASVFYEHPEKKVKIIGVTGTNGKTTSTYILESIIGRVSRIGTVEYKIGDEVFASVNTTPESLDLIKILNLTAKKGIEYLVMEVSSHSLEMGRVEMLDFDVAIFTNLSQDHLDYHKDMENYFLAKRKLFLKLKDKKNSVINIDDDYGLRLYKEFGGISYGAKGELKGKVIDHSLSDMTIKLSYNSVEIVKKVKLMGLFNLYNIMGAIGGAICLGLDFEEICERLETMSKVPGRFESISLGQDYMVVVDYAHSPDGIRNILKALSEIKKKKIITVFGAGGDRDRKKRPLMTKEVSRYSDYIIMTSDNPRSENPERILEDVESGMEKDMAITYEKIINRERAIERAIELAEKDDIILIAGKGHETYQIIGKEKIHFDDKEIAGKYIRKNL